jgi:RHS repeat-associated protein
MRTSVTEQDGRRVDYKYDALYRLTEEKITDSVNGNRTTTYTMDAVGNRLSKADSVDGTTSYVYDANDRLLNETKGVEQTVYGYDGNGNTKSKTKGTDVTLYSWNDQGRLVSVQNPSSDAVSYEYNENGIRVSSTINGVKTSYLLDANRDYAQVLEEYDNSGTQVSYLYGHDLISQNRDGAKSFYLYDGLGSTKALTDASGVVTDRYIYDAYGNVLSSIGSTQNSYLYTGEQFDAGVGQYYLRDRYYNQVVGRFTRSDTWEGLADYPITLNSYMYGNANPINMVDRSGFASILEVNAIFVNIAVLSSQAYTVLSTPVVIESVKLIAALIAIGALTNSYVSHGRDDRKSIVDTNTGDDNRDNFNQMRVQLQKQNDTYGVPLVSSSKTGVTLAQVGTGLFDIWQTAKGGQLSDWFSFNRYEKNLYNAIIDVSKESLDRRNKGGVSAGREQVATSQWLPDGTPVRRGVYRVDVENLRGHNLRY